MDSSMFPFTSDNETPSMNPPMNTPNNSPTGNNFTGNMPMTSERRRCGGTIYIVEQGDTLYKIAKKYRLRVSDLLKSNPYVNVYNLQIGEELCIPVKSYPANDNLTPYIVKPNDTLGAIMKNNEISYDQLVKYNPFIEKLKIPAKTVVMLPKTSSND